MTFTEERNKQIAALSKIMNLIDQSFPLAYSNGIYSTLESWIALDRNESLEYDQTRKIYYIETQPVCKVCNETRNTTGLTEIQTVGGKFWICETCRSEIANPQKTEVKTSKKRR